MLVRFTTTCVACVRCSPLLGLCALACSLVVGELPPSKPDSGPLAGAGGSGSTAGGSQGGGAAGRGAAGAPAKAGTGSGAGAPAGECDADLDSHAAEGACAGDDCDDTDPNVWPGQPKYFAERQANADYDYDCNGAPEQEQQAAVVCAGVSLSACPTQTGFLKTLPACGVAGRWGKCTKGSLTCDETVIDDMRRMRCH